MVLNQPSLTHGKQSQAEAETWKTGSCGTASAQPMMVTTSARCSSPRTNPRLRRSLTDAMLKAVAGAAHGLYGQHEAIALDAIPDTSVGAALDRHLNLWKLVGLSGSFASGTVTSISSSSSSSGGMPSPDSIMGGSTSTRARRLLRPRAATLS